MNRENLQKKKTLINLFFVIIILFLLILISLSFLNNYFFIKKINYYNIQFEKGNFFILRQDFLNALNVFENLYKKGFKTIAVIKNCIYLYQITNQSDKLYIFIRKTCIDKGYYPKYTKYLYSILSEDYHWVLKICLIDYINIYFVLFFQIFSILGLLFIIIIFSKTKNIKLLFLIILILNFVILCLFFIKISYYIHRDEAISIEQTEVYNFPLIDSIPIFTLQEHVKLKARRNFENYTLIQLSNGKKGWIQSKSILKVFDD